MTHLNEEDVANKTIADKSDMSIVASEGPLHAMKGSQSWDFNTVNVHSKNNTIQIRPLNHTQLTIENEQGDQDVVMIVDSPTNGGGGASRSRLAQRLKNAKQISKRDIETVLLNLISRKRFVYTVRDMFAYLFRCLCLRKKSKQPYMSHHNMFAKGETKLMSELNVISLLRSMRQIKLLTMVTLSQK